MASHIPLNDLIEALAGAVIEAQDNIEQHQISNLLGYFDSQKRPKSLVVRLPSTDPKAEEGSEDYYRAPLLPLVSTNLLKIKDVEITFDVDLGHFTEEPAATAKKADAVEEGRQQEAPKKSIFVDTAGVAKNKGGSIHVVLRVEGSEPTDGAARLMNHLTQTQGVFKTVKVD
ncbi:protein of unknown function DUF2589 [Geotalea daltonii FRC-32]|uniref:DUF2589 domain-containing protein n=1 Tax=Geotalea daltonii (strain DSM 22248 / JCM 15807 / FRC-32) TaxID=316067 RepID=B9M485_GEODF|nr:DUF2589 domain-containing protein [Geotalea daltonii]ACM21540.1 protein of unknown function DUF2589 [Geotalea daltonii FRC-32]